MKKVRYLVYGLFGGFVVLCPLVFDCFSALCRFRAAFVCLYALGFIFLLKALLAPGRRLRIALPDVLLALYLSWGACNLLFVKAGGTDALPIFGGFPCCWDTCWLAACRSAPCRSSSERSSVRVACRRRPDFYSGWTYFRPTTTFFRLPAVL